jgi:hypothetical protein
MVRYQAAGELRVQRMATGGCARMHQGTVAGRASSLLRGDIRCILEDVVDRDQLPASSACRGSLESWRCIASI